MKILKRITAALILVAVLVAATGCYVISAQSMRRVKGTYKLTAYTYTEKHERKDGYTPRKIDYINDAEYLYEDYLVITGTSTGYYLHKDASGEAYLKEITLSYVHSEEESDKIEYVIFNDALTEGEDSEFHKLGVTKNKLNYTKSAFDYTELITKRSMRSEAMTVRWEKVDRATDISYAIEQIGEHKTYSYSDFGIRGIYELTTMEAESGIITESEYRYLYYVIDPAEGNEKATLVYATEGAPSEQMRRELPLSVSDGCMMIDGVSFRVDQQFGLYYNAVIDGLEHQLRPLTHDISAEALEALLPSAE